MQAWELERELGRTQDKLEAIKNACEGMIQSAQNDTRVMVSQVHMAKGLLKILDDRSSGE